MLETQDQRKFTKSVCCNMDSATEFAGSRPSFLVIEVRSTFDTSHGLDWYFLRFQNSRVLFKDLEAINKQSIAANH